MRGRIRRSTTVIAAVGLAALLAVPGAALAAGQGHGQGGGNSSGGQGGGNGGGPPASEIGNNLSVPAIVVAGKGSFTFACPQTEPIDPPADPAPLTGYPEPGYYYVQGVHTWQAECATALPEDAIVIAKWGDNLSGDAKLKVGSPIRVEVGLDAGEQGMLGYNVIKLQPLELDRISAYGTLAAEAGGVFSAVQTTTFPSVAETRVYDIAATLKIYNALTPDAPIYDGPATAEVNATGRIVYGYNLRVPTAGAYVLEFRTVNVTMSNAADGSDGLLFTKTINVGGGGGGGGHR